MSDPIVAIDPGSERSAFVVYDGARIREHQIVTNGALLTLLPLRVERMLVIESVESYGMPVGREIFDTVWWSGRFVQIWDGAFQQLPRRAVKLHLCGQPRAKDANIRAALMDKFGGSKRLAVGVKAAPGPLYGIVGDEWAALALAVTWWDQQSGGEQ